MSVLGVHPGALGDVILFGHLLSRMEGRITLVAGEEKGKLLLGMRVVGRAMSFESLPMQEIFTDEELSGCELPNILGTHDRLISCFPSGDRTAELRMKGMCGASEAVFLPVRPPESFAGHLVGLWCDRLGIPREGPILRRWSVPASWIDEGREALRAIGLDASERYVVIHPGAGARDKCWGIERFEELSRTMDNAVFVVGPVEQDRWDGEAIDRLRASRPTLVCPSLQVLTGVLTGAGVFVGNDSGVGHLAGAVGVATVVLFGATRAEHFAPLGPNVQVISSDNLSDISSDQVLRVATDLQTRGSNRVR